MKLKFINKSNLIIVLIYFCSSIGLCETDGVGSAPLTSVSWKEGVLDLSFMGGDCTGIVTSKAQVTQFKSSMTDSTFEGVLVTLQNSEINCSGFRILKEIHFQTPISDLIKTAVKRLPRQYWTLPVRVQLPLMGFQEHIQ